MRRKLAPILLTAVVLAWPGAFAPGAETASPAASRTPTASVPIPEDLLGSWHSTSIDGDALFLIVWSFEVDLAKDGTFKAHVAFTDGQKKSIDGRYRAEAGEMMTFEIPGVGSRESARYWFENPDVLVIDDESFGVRFHVHRGKAKTSSGADWF